MSADFRACAFFVAALASVPANAVPPPPPRAADLLPLATTTCPIDVTGSAQPYSPAIYRFNGNAENMFVLVNAKPDMNLNFSLGIENETPLITGAGFGAGVNIRLPLDGTYQLKVSSFDPVQKKALAAEFKIWLALRGEKVPDGC